MRPRAATPVCGNGSLPCHETRLCIGAIVNRIGSTWLPLGCATLILVFLGGLTLLSRYESVPLTESHYIVPAVQSAFLSSERCAFRDGRHDVDSGHLIVRFSCPSSDGSSDRVLLDRIDSNAIARGWTRAGSSSRYLGRIDPVPSSLLARIEIVRVGTDRQVHISLN